MTKKKIKIYFHHNLYKELPSERSWLGIPKLLKLFFNPIYQICFFTGITLIKILKLGIRSVVMVGELIINIILSPKISFFWLKKNIQKKRINFKLYELKFSLIMFLVFLVTVSVFMKTGLVVGNGLITQGQVLGSAAKGFDSLNSAKQALENQQAGLAKTQFSTALFQFQETKTQLTQVGGQLNRLLALVPQKRDADNLISAISDLTEAGIALSKSYEIINSVQFSAQGLNLGVDNQQTLFLFSKELSYISEKVNSANTKLKTVSESSIPKEHRLAFVQNRDMVEIASKSIINFEKVYGLFQEIFTGQKTALIFFQNNNELRATGGFLGTYGNFQLLDGLIKSLKISSIYDLDGQLTDKINPPAPIYAVNDRWYLRDSNWFFDFPSSAKKMISFYEKEGGETPDLVLTVTPDLVVSLLKVTGSVDLPSYGIKLNSENFVEVTQVTTSVNYNKTLNQPKQMLADFFPILLQKISDLDFKQKLQAMQVLQMSLTKKDIMIYSTNNALQEKLKQFNWTGQTYDADRDYLAVVSSNLGGTKTDLGIKQSLKIDTQINPDGSIINTLSLTRKNTFPEQAQTINKSFLRFYVPENSELIEATGFSLVDEPKINPNYLKDPDVAKIESSTLQNPVNKTYISKESNKTVFGNWVILKGGETQTITLRYKLPFELSSLDRYSLLTQKQSGANTIDVTQSINFPDYKIIWKNFGDKIEANRLIEHQFDLSTDKYFGVVLERIE